MIASYGKDAQITGGWWSRIGQKFYHRPGVRAIDLHGKYRKLHETEKDFPVPGHPPLRGWRFGTRIAPDHRRGGEP
jgi:hypothetical protein